MGGKTIQRIIRVSSVNRQDPERTKPDDFRIKFTPALMLPEDMDHEVGLSQLTMTYSWHNITESYRNNKFKYSSDGGKTWHGKMLVKLAPGWQLDLRDSEFENLVGFDKKIVTATEVGSRLPNITNGVDEIYLESSISSSLVDGIPSNTLAVIPTVNLRRSFPFKVLHPYLLLMPVSTSLIQDIHFSMKDALNRPIDLNGVDWHLELVLRSTLKV